ncbi:MAG: ABC transporter substrate-binding protein [Planctomycetes bacterium]|nr:ABC transporter substrate-binding protein [Planctomycetota bacterium]
MKSLFAFAVTPVLLAAELSAQTHYRLSVDPWIAWSPAMIAQKKGMWKRHGIDVEVVLYTASDTVAQFRAGRNDFALVMAGTAVGIQVTDGVDLTVLAEVDWSHGGDKIVVEKGAGLAEMKGRRIAVYEDTPAVTMFLAESLRAGGLRLADFELVELNDLESLASQFLAGRVCAAVSYEPYSTSLTEKGVCQVMATTADFPGIMPECLVAHNKHLKDVPVGDITALFKGWMDAVAWVKDPANEAEFRRICLEDFFFDERPKPEEIPLMMANVRIHDTDMLRRRNLREDGIKKFLDDCTAFALKRYPHKESARRTVVLDTRGLERALGPVAAPPK